LQFKPIFVLIFCLSLIGCDQVRGKLINGFDWDRKISTINNNELPPQNTNQISNNLHQSAPIVKGKPLDRSPINILRADSSKGQSLVVEKPKKNMGNASENSDELSPEVLGQPDSQATVVPKKVRQSSYKNVSGMSENDW
jgi:hypothetical protein